MYKVNGELSSCGIKNAGRVPFREGGIHNFAYSLLLNGLSKSAQTFTVGFVKLLSTHPIHFVVWRNFPFRFFHVFEPKRPKGFKINLQGTVNIPSILFLSVCSHYCIRFISMYKAHHTY